jgi:hypothetical protein
MDLDEQARRLRMHVEQLAGKIGERNVFCPASLHATASYIEHEWEQQGYAVERLAYDVSGVRCLNLEITRSGGTRDREILLIGAHYDTVTGSPGANDNASGVSALLELSRLSASIDPALTVAGGRVGKAGGRIKKIMIVALARKLLIALWRYAKDGVIPEGAKMKMA